MIKFDSVRSSRFYLINTIIILHILISFLPYQHIKRCGRNDIKSQRQGTKKDTSVKENIKLKKNQARNI